MLAVTAFTHREDGTLRDAMTGAVLPADYDGYCLVTFKSGTPMVFHTGINAAGERYWWAIGNNPWMPRHYASYERTCEHASR